MFHKTVGKRTAPKPPKAPKTPNEPTVSQEPAAPIEPKAPPAAQAPQTAQFPGAQRKVPVPLIVLLVIVAALVAAFAITCAVAVNLNTIFPNTSISGIDIGGMTQEEAITAVTSALEQRYEGKEILLKFPDFEYEKTLSVTDAGASTDAEAAVKTAYATGREHGLLQSGLSLISSLFTHHEIEAQFSMKDTAYLRRFLSDVAAQIDNPVVEHSYTAESKQLVITRGHTGYGLNQEDIFNAIVARLETQDYSDLVCDSTVTDPAPLDWDAIYDAVYVKPADATYDESTYQLTREITGVSFDKEAAIAAFEAAEPDASVTVPLIFTTPEITLNQLTSSIFKNILGTCTSNVGGSSNRASNVKLAASLVNGTILLPGETFSYNGTVGSRKASRGFLPAPIYAGGETVNETGGGVCQVSSTIYLASLRANLQIVERHNHSYTVGYVPDGMDATVYYGSLDFQFKNDSDQPILIASSMDGRKLTVNLYGVKAASTTVKVTNKVLSTTPYKTVYEEDASVSSSTVKTTGYTGKKVETYRSVYDLNGTLLSSKLEATSTYKTRNKVVLVPVKPQSSSSGSGSSGSTTTATPAPTPTPAPTSTPAPAAESAAPQTEAAA